LFNSIKQANGKWNTFEPKISLFLFFENFSNLSEPTVPNLELVFDSLIKTYYKLIELGFVEINDIITLIDNQEDEL
jgi:hypothetical protein